MNSKMNSRYVKLERKVVDKIIKGNKKYMRHLVKRQMSTRVGYAYKKWRINPNC